MSTGKVECDVCGRCFDSKRSLASHKGAGHDKPWMDKDNLVTEYVEKGKTSDQLAQEWRCDPKTVRNWLDRFDIEIRSLAEYHRQEYVNFAHHEQGYEVWKLSYGEDRGKTVLVHRLLAVAEYGTDAIKDMHVHHKKRVPWLNTPENIELKDGSEHARHHYENGDLEISPNTAKEEMENSL